MENEVRILYRNWRGEVTVRTIKPVKLWHGSTEWHPELQWLLEAVDMGDPNKRTKDYAMLGILAWGDEAIEARLNSKLPHAGEAVTP